MTTRRTTEEKARAYAALRQSESFVDESADASLFAVPEDERERAWQYTPTGLELHRALSRDEYRGGLMVELQVMETARQLIIGDAYLTGIDQGHIDSYDDMAELSGYKAGSIEVYASLCRSIPRLMRINSVTFSHYQVIAPLPEDHRADWIQHVADRDLSVSQLKKAVAEYYHALPAPTPPPVTFAITNEMELKRAGKKLAEIEQMLPEKRKEKHFLLYRGIVAAMKDYIASKEKWIEQGGAGDNDGA